MKNTGTKAIQDEKNAVKNALDFLNKLEKILEESFNSDRQMKSAIKNSFETFINLQANQFAEIYCKSIHKILSNLKQPSLEKQGDKDKDMVVEEKPIDGQLEENFKLFSYI